MNKARRSKLDKAYRYLSTAEEIVTEVLEQEQDAFDNLPENLQDSQMACSMEDAISALEDVSDAISEAIQNITEII